MEAYSIKTLLQDPANDEIQIYVHVPFCKSRCIYCDFYTFIAKPGSSGISRFSEDLKLQADTLLADKKHRLKSLYFGGGTPSFLGESLAELVTHITDLCEVSPDIEITVEANPESCTVEFIEACKKAGVTRISLGVQAFNEEVLKLLSRATYLGQVNYAIKLLQDSGLEFSLDLIAGIPGVDMGEWETWILTAIATNANHLSIYPLSVEEGTPLARMIAAGEIAAPDEDASADQLLRVQELLGEAGYLHYEISNYAKAGHESIHNSGYWTSAPYLGLGPHASSMLYKSSGDARTRLRFMIHENLPEFFKDPSRLEIQEYEVLDADMTEREDLSLRLRLMRGVSRERLLTKLSPERLSHFIEAGVLEERDGRISLTQDKWLIANEVFEAVWHS